MTSWATRGALARFTGGRGSEFACGDQATITAFNIGSIINRSTTKINEVE